MAETDKEFLLGDMIDLGREIENLRQAISTVRGYAQLAAASLDKKRLSEIQSRLANDIHTKLSGDTDDRSEAMYYFTAGADYILDDVLNTAIENVTGVPVDRGGNEN